MKTKQIITLITGMSLTSTALTEEAGVAPDINQLEEISVFSPTWWHISFNPDGSAELSGGANIYEVARAPAGRFSFEEIYNLLAPHLLVKNNDVDYKEVLQISFRIGTSDEGRALGKGFYLKDKEPMRKLMHGICDRLLPR